MNFVMVSGATGEIVAIEGKSLRGAKEYAGERCLHLVYAYASVAPVGFIPGSE